jgi:hypothetical protein
MIVALDLLVMTDSAGIADNVGLEGDVRKTDALVRS